MAAFNAGAYRASSGTRGAPGLRFTVYAVLAVVLMFLDRRGDWLVRARYYMDAAVYPVQLAVNSPTLAWRWLEQSFTTREQLEARNAQLTARDRELSLQVQRLQALEHENAELRGLKDALPSLAERWLVAEVVNIGVSDLRQRVLLNRGARNEVFRGQAVMDESGLLGQTVRVNPWSAEVILITDPEHAVPVQIQRTGVHTLAVGTGDARALALPYLPANADVKDGDLLVTSGLGGVFPQGYPVARVTEVRHDAVEAAERIRATPTAHLDALREVMLVWFNDGNPAAPDHGDGATGNPALQPQNTPPLEPLPPLDIPRLKQTQTPADTSAPASAPQARPASAPAQSSTSQASAPQAQSASRQAPSSAPQPKPADKPADTPGAGPKASSATSVKPPTGKGSAP